MSKRKRRNSTPNLPQAALDRAREEVEGTPESDEVEEKPKQTIDREARRARRREEKTTSSSASSRRRNRSPEVVQYSQRRKDSNTMDHNMLRQMLARPTKNVTEEELQAEYSYVVRDIRSMFVLAGVLMVALVLLAQFI